MEGSVAKKAKKHFVCEVCDKSLCSSASRKRHLESVHGIRCPPAGSKTSDKKTCNICNKTFSSTSVKRRHTREVHDALREGCAKPTAVECRECSVNFPKLSIYRQHLQQLHSIATTRVQYEFASEKEFMAWKTGLESKVGVIYIAHAGTNKKSIDGTKTIYYCQKSGVKKSSQSTDIGIEESQVTSKVGSYCTSSIEVVKQNGCLQVTYYVDHHDHDANSLSFVRRTLPPTVKDNGIEDKIDAEGLEDAAITDAILYMVCKDALPLSATEHEGLRLLLKTTVPLYEVPGRKRLTTLLKNKYSSLKEAVRRQLSQAQWVSITLDLTSVTSKGYFIVSGHFVDCGSLRSICLGVPELPPSHTGDHIARGLSLVLQSWNLDTEKISSVTTIGEENITLALRKLMDSEGTHVPCFAHLLNLCVCQSLESHSSVKAVIDKVKIIVDYFRRSTSASDALLAAQHESGVQAPQELLQPVMAEGSSVFYSLERFIDLAGSVCQVLLSADHPAAPPMLASEELALVNDVVSVLKPFERASKEVSGEKYVTATIIIPIINCLKESVSQMSQLFTSKDLSLLSEVLLANIDRLLIPLEDNHLLASATMLDPRFKLIHFQQHINSANTLQWLSLELHGLAAGSAPEAAVPRTEEEISGQGESLWQIHDQLASRLSTEIDLPSRNELHPELKLYINLPVMARSQCPLKFWLDRERTFPTLSRLAQKYLSVMGSSIASECIVSLVNSNACDLQNSLLPEHVNMLVFMSSLEKSTWFR